VDTTQREDVTTTCGETAMKDEALDLALEALEMCKAPWTGTLDYNLTEAITAIKQARSAPVQEPVATLLQQSKENFERNFGSNGYADWIYKDLADLLDTPPAAQPAPVLIGNTVFPSKAQLAEFFSKPPAQRQWVGKDIKAFEAHVRADERERVMNEPLTKAQWQRFEDEIRADEREACLSVIKPNATPMEIAAAIRARGNT
jgi:hypothetical protein